VEDSFKEVSSPPFIIVATIVSVMLVARKIMPSTSKQKYFL